MLRVLQRGLGFCPNSSIRRNLSPRRSTNSEGSYSRTWNRFQGRSEIAAPGLVTDRFGVEQVMVTTMQGLSGAGRSPGVSSLEEFRSKFAELIPR